MLNTKDRNNMMRKNPNIPLPKLTKEAELRWEIEQFKYEVEKFCRNSDTFFSGIERKEVKGTEVV